MIKVAYRKAQIEDADLLIQLYNASFYKDYITYGECPAYGRTIREMEKSIEKIPKWIIYVDHVPVGAISAVHRERGEYFIACLCIIPEYQGKGIGSNAVTFLLSQHPDWNKVTLITPADKEENINFYTKKCGFRIEGVQMDGNVKVVQFAMERVIE